MYEKYLRIKELQNRNQAHNYFTAFDWRGSPVSGRGFDFQISITVFVQVNKECRTYLQLCHVEQSFEASRTKKREIYSALKVMRCMF